jgi:hypothetical protein
MRVVELSNHPRVMLQAERKRRAVDTARDRARHEAALDQHRHRVDQARRARDQARAQHRWLAWLRGVFAVAGEKRRVPAPPRSLALPSEQEEIITAGMQGEKLVATALGRSLGKEWTLFRGYRNRGGEIDQLLLGPGGLFAIEVKYRNATVSCDGDRWWFTRYDNYGKPVAQGELTDQRGRSPSEQVNQPASRLEDFLRSRRHRVQIQRIVALTHPRSRLGNCVRPTVLIVTSPSEVISLLKGSPPRIESDERHQLEELIIRDHQFHARRLRS